MKRIKPFIEEDMTSLDSLLPDFSEPLPGELDFIEWLNTPQPGLFDIDLERTPDE